MMGIFIPEQYGGAGLDHISYSLVIEELGVECSSTAVILFGAFLARVVADSRPVAMKSSASVICRKWRRPNGSDASR